MKHFDDIKNLLDEKYHQFNNTSFIETDPICIPHQFTKKQDIEIAALLVATIAWGQRKSIIANGNKLMHLMDYTPYEFIKYAKEKDFNPFKKFVHRTFNGEDCIFFLKSLQKIYSKNVSLEEVFVAQSNNESCKENIISFRNEFLKPKHLPRVEKHVSNPDKNSSAKRLCMFLRWMVRKDKHGVDFGIWNKIDSSKLCMPLDVHTGNVSRSLGLLIRTQNDWTSVEELTNNLKLFDAKDPVKYDFALFGLGAFEGWK